VFLPPLTRFVSYRVHDSSHDDVCCMWQIVYAACHYTCDVCASDNTTGCLTCAYGLLFEPTPGQTSGSCVEPPSESGETHDVRCRYDWDVPG
jgi:hypothetical protein